MRRLIRNQSKLRPDTEWNGGSGQVGTPRKAREWAAAFKRGVSLSSVMVLLYRLEQQVLLVEAEVSLWRHSSQPHVVDAAIGVQREGDKSVFDSAVPPVGFELFVLPVPRIAAPGRLGWGADLPGS